MQDTEDGCLLQLPDEEQKKEFHSILEWADETKSFVAVSYTHLDVYKRQSL